MSTVRWEAIYLYVLCNLPLGVIPIIIGTRGLVRRKMNLMTRPRGYRVKHYHFYDRSAVTWGATNILFGIIFMMGLGYAVFIGDSYLAIILTIIVCFIVLLIGSLITFVEENIRRTKQEQDEARQHETH